MGYCPFISTPEQKRMPSDYNCKDCCFHCFDIESKTKGCAILIAANNSSLILQKLVNKK